MAEVRLSSTTAFQLYPWEGGVNTSRDESTIPPNQLTVGDNVVFGVRGSRRQRDGVNHNWDGSAAQSANVIGLFDFWLGNPTRSQAIVGVLDNSKIYSYIGGTRSSDLFGGTAWSTTPTIASMCAFNSCVIIGVDGSGNVPKKWTGTGSVADLGGTPPAASFFREHVGRLWCNDKSNPDRLHCSPVGDHETWNGAGDSWAIDIAAGDGDPIGITCAFSFKGVLYVGKRSRLYKVIGKYPEEFEIVNVSKSLGIAGPDSFCHVDDTDVVFVSQKGVHSLAAVEARGDIEDEYLSADIQGTFNDQWLKSRLKYVRCAYHPNLNSVVCAVTDTEYGTVFNNTLWLYNIPLKSWYRWPSLSCQALCLADDSDKVRFYLGTNAGRVSKTFAGTNYDTDTAGSSAAIIMRLHTGILYLDDSPLTSKALKHFFLLYKPGSTHNISVAVRVDNGQYQTLTFSNSGSNALLGSTFTLGTSVLGYNLVMAPYYAELDGCGRGVKVIFETSGVNRFSEIQGFGIEWEPAELQHEITDGT